MVHQFAVEHTIHIGMGRLCCMRCYLMPGTSSNKVKRPAQCAGQKRCRRLVNFDGMLCGYADITQNENNENGYFHQTNFFNAISNAAFVIPVFALCVV